MERTARFSGHRLIRAGLNQMMFLPDLVHPQMRVPYLFSRSESVEPQRRVHNVDAGAKSHQGIHPQQPLDRTCKGQIVADDRGGRKDSVEHPQRVADYAWHDNHVVRSRDPHAIGGRARRAADRFENLHRCHRMVRAGVEEQLDVVSPGGTREESVADE